MKNKLTHRANLRLPGGVEDGPNPNTVHFAEDLHAEPVAACTATLSSLRSLRRFGGADPPGGMWGSQSWLPPASAGAPQP